VGVLRCRNLTFRSTRTACKLRLQVPSAASPLWRPVTSNVMSHSQRFTGDRQLMLIVAIWAVMLFDAFRQGIGLPRSQYLPHWPERTLYVLLLFAVLAPPVIVAANHLIPVHLGGGWMDWPRRIIDRRFGAGTASRFWRRLRPLVLGSAGAFVIGIAGYISSYRAGAAPGAFDMSKIFIGFGCGLLLGALLESYAFKDSNAT
jgi:hypothetical protein